MPSFTPINVNDDELDVEEHTREMQIERALEVFDSALKLQKQRKYHEADKLYDDLFDIEVVRGHNETRNPTIEQLKYLAYRNRGFLKMEELLQPDYHELDANGEPEETSEVDRYSKLIMAMNDLLEAIEHSNPDLKLVELVSELCAYYGLERMARYGYEYKFIPGDGGVANAGGASLGAVDDELGWDLKSPRELVPNQLYLLDRYRKLLDKLHDEKPQMYDRVTAIFEDQRYRKTLAARKPRVADFGKIVSQKQFKDLYKWQNDLIEVDISFKGQEIDLEELLYQLNEILPKPKARSKVFDNYVLTEAPIDRITFKLIDKTEAGDLEDKPQHALPQSDANEGAEEGDEARKEQQKQPDHEVAAVGAGAGSATSDSSVTPVAVVNEESGPDPTALPVDLTPAQRIAAKRHTRAATEPVDTTPAEPTKEMFEGQAKFLESFSNFIRLSGIKRDFADLPQIVIAGRGRVADSDIRINYFQKFMEDWGTPQTEALLVHFGNDDRDASKDGSNSGGDAAKSSAAEDQSSAIKDILNSSQPQKEVSEQISLCKLDNGKLLALVRELNEGHYHIDQIRWKLVRTLFSWCGEHGGTLFTEGTVPKYSYESFKSILDSLDVLFLTDCRKRLLHNPELDDEVYGIATSYLEVLVDSELSLQNEMHTRKMNRNLAQELEGNQRTLNGRINNWSEFLDDAFSLIDLSSAPRKTIQCWLRWNWARTLYVQHQSELDTKELYERLSDMSRKAASVDLRVQMANYDFIPRLSAAAIDIQLSKLQILDAFSTNDQSNEILENILLMEESSEGTASSKVENEMRQLVKKSPVDLKLRLWSVLLAYYESSKNVSGYKHGFYKALEAMIDSISLDKMEKLPPLDENQAVLRTLGFFGLMAGNYVKFIAKQNWDLARSYEDEEALSYLLNFFAFIYTFFLHEDAAVQATERTSLKAASAKSFEKLMDTAVYTFTLIAVYFDLTLENPAPESINDFLSILHVQLGLRSICNNTEGCFLQFLQYKLSQMCWEGSDYDFFQVVNCRYGLPVTIETFQTFDHEAEHYPMTHRDAIELCHYVIPYCYRKKHPLLNPPRADIKAILDNVYKSVGELDFRNVSVINNNKSLHVYLDTQTLDLDLIRRAFRGELKVDIHKLITKNADVAFAGLYFMQAVMALHGFRVRKRAMQGRSAELDFIIKMLELDLVSGTDRFESWMLLGQSYSYRVEDDIVWTSDKLNSEEKKAGTASLQRQAILCYLMAASVFCRKQQSEDKNPIAAMLWNLLGKELYSAWMKPMCKLAFLPKQLDASSSRLGSPFSGSAADSAGSSSGSGSGSSSGDISISHDERTAHISDQSMLMVIALAFREAGRLDQDDWYNPMYIVKSTLKLHDDRYLTTNLRLLLNSCSLAMTASSRDDPIVEPHYLLCSVVFKYVVAGKMPVLDGLHMLVSDPLFAEVPAAVSTPASFSKAIISALNICIQYDKKSWQHKPHYRIARIALDQLGNVDQAIEEMDLIMNLKPTTRSLSTIWKPENERPGKHFVYNFMYTNFYIELMEKSSNVYALIQLVKKLRKLGSSMVCQIRSFDSAVAKTCVMIKKIVNVPEGYMDEQISNMVYPEFVEYSKEFVKDFGKKSEYTSEERIVLYFLSEVSGFRRMANGFAATGVIDDCYHSLYLWLFMPYLEKRLSEVRAHPNYVNLGNPSTVKFVGGGVGSNPQQRSPTASTREKIKVARRDITPYCVQLLGNTQKVVEEEKVAYSQGTEIPYNRFAVSNNKSYEGVIAASRVDWLGDSGCISMADSGEALMLNDLTKTFCTKHFGSVGALDLVKVPVSASPKRVVSKLTFIKPSEAISSAETKQATIEQLLNARPSPAAAPAPIAPVTPTPETPKASVPPKEVTPASAYQDAQSSFSGESSPSPQKLVPRPTEEPPLKKPKIESSSTDDKTA